MNTTPLIFIAYEGIEHSTFHGQVIMPLLKQKKVNPTRKIILISFETTKPNKQYLAQLFPAQALTFIAIKKPAFIAPFSLWPAIRQLQKFLKDFNNYEMVAAGPLAGYVALHAANKDACTLLTIQARGLCAEEHWYYYQKKSHFINFLWHRFIAWQLQRLEAQVLQPNSFNHKGLNVTIEAISPALKDHLIAIYNIDPAAITIARNDIPEPLKLEQKMKWRVATRSELAIPEHYYVYCFNGSWKLWHKPEQVVEFFIKKLQENSDVFLLVLTHDVHKFYKLIRSKEIDKNHFRVLSANHHDMYYYLAACDAGIMFADNHTINLVARPTKVLEYQAAGLTIIHNNTIDYLVK